MKQKLAEFYELLFGFRKFIIAIMVLTVSIIFRTKDLLSGKEFADLVEAVTISFFGSNTVEGVVTVVKDHLQGNRDIAAGKKEDCKEEDKEVDLTLPGEAR